MFGIDARTPADFRRPSRPRFLRGVRSTLVVAAAMWLGATGDGCHAAIVDYGFSSNASTIVHGTPEPIMGSFQFDPATGIQYGGTIEIGPSIIFGADMENLGIGAAAVVGEGFQITFADSLSAVAVDALSSVDLYGILVPVDTAPTGFVCPDSLAASCAATVPEPTSLALLGAALGLFLVSSRAIRRPGPDFRPPAQEPGFFPE